MWNNADLADAATVIHKLDHVAILRPSNTTLLLTTLSIFSRKFSLSSNHRLRKTRLYSWTGLTWIFLGIQTVSEGRFFFNCHLSDPTRGEVAYYLRIIELHFRDHSRLAFQKIQCCVLYCSAVAKHYVHVVMSFFMSAFIGSVVDSRPAIEGLRILVVLCFPPFLPKSVPTFSSAIRLLSVLHCYEVESRQAFRRTMEVSKWIVPIRRLSGGSGMYLKLTKAWIL